MVAIDARRTTAEDDDPERFPSGFRVFVRGGREGTDLDVLDWARTVEELGAGELLLTSMDRDGTRDGFDNELTRAVSEAVNIPVIASGGVGGVDDLANGVTEGRADAVLAASIFHFGEASIADAKRAMARAGVTVRPPD